MFQRPLYLELWHEMCLEHGMLMRTMDAISARFQNIYNSGENDGLSNYESSPLRPLSDFLWGWINAASTRLTARRRIQEYKHQYGPTTLDGSVLGVQAADVRTAFPDAFMNLMSLCEAFYREDNQTTVIADAFPVLFGLNATLARCLSRPGRPPHPRLDCRAADQFEEAIERILTVAPLRAVSLRDDDQNAIAREPGAAESLKPRSHFLRQRWRLPHIEAKLDRGRELIDILPARARSAHEAFFDFALVDADLCVDADHVAANVALICYGLAAKSRRLASRPRLRPYQTSIGAG